MTSLDRLHRFQRSLTAAIVARALLGGAATALVIVAIARVVGAAGTSRAFTMAIAVAAGVIVTLVLGRTLPASRSIQRVALFVEERTPALRYALVTIADGVQSSTLDEQAERANWWRGDARSATRRAVVPAALAFLASVALAIWLPVIHSGATNAIARTAASRGAPGTVVDPLAHVHAAVTPPSYAGRPSLSLDDPTSIEALVGSTITLNGQGDASSLRAQLDSAPRGVASRSGGWSVTLAMPARPALVRLRSAAGKDRLVVLAPITDAIPVVTLLSPAHDTVVRVAHGALALRAQLRDDIGLRDAQFELVVSSGSGENFTFRSTIVGRSTLGGRGESVLEARLPLDSLALKPGDVLQLRAIARDANNVTGPGIGSSETRSLRVARADEYDSLAVDAAPPPEAEAGVLSQRMLLDLTIALEKHRPSLARPMLVEESRRIAFDQRKLRKRVGDVVFQRLGAQPLSEEGSDEPEPGKLTPEEVLKRADAATSTAGDVMDVEGDETPILAINKPLLEAYNAMWDAGRALEVGDTRAAIPPMRIALAAIEKARQAERIYLRGRPSTVIVDLAKARLQGKEKGTSSVLEALPVTDPVTRKRAESFSRATELATRDPDAAADTLLVMRVNALGDAPLLAAALDDAAKALRAHDANAVVLAWTRVRRAIGGAPAQHPGVSAWLGGGAP